MNASSKIKNKLPFPSFIIPLTYIWLAIVALVCTATSLTIVEATDFGGLGRPVQLFATLVVLLPIIPIIYLLAGLSQEKQAKTHSKNGLVFTILMIVVMLLGVTIAVAVYPIGQILAFAVLVITLGVMYLCVSQIFGGFFPNYADARYGLLFFTFIGMVLSFVVLIWQSRAFSGLEFLVNAFEQQVWVGLLFVGAWVLLWLAGRAAEDNLAKKPLQYIALGAIGVGIIILLVQANIFEGIVALLSTYQNPVIIGATISGIVFSILAINYLNYGEEFGETPFQRQAWQGWLMLAPNILGFMIFFAGPLLLSLYLSFTDDTVGQEPNFIGLQNYAEIFTFEVKQQPITDLPQRALSFGNTEWFSIESGATRTVIGARDAQFWNALRNTVVFCLMLLPLAIVPAILLSLVLNSSLPGMKFYRAVYFLPSVAAVVGTALIWRWLYSPNIGYYNYIITSIITWFNQTFGWSINDPQIGWLTDPSVVLFSVVLLAAWQVIGNNTVLFLAGLQGIPRELYEAASIDGANGSQQFFSVTLPMLRPVMFFVMINTMIAGLQVFNEPYTLFPSRPIVQQAETSVFYLYQQGFFQFNFGYASAIAWFLFILIFSLTFIQFRVQRSEV
jgi:ABC-type sugar transport system permease subunit